MVELLPSMQAAVTFNPRKRTKKTEQAWHTGAILLSQHLEGQEDHKLEGALGCKLSYREDFKKGNG